MTRYWLLLLLAACFEVGWVVGLRAMSKERPVVSALVLVSYVLSFVFLERAVRGIPLGIAYAVWTGIGVVGGFALAAVLYDEKPNLPQVLFAGLVLIGVVGLYATSTNEEPQQVQESEQ